MAKHINMVGGSCLVGVPGPGPLAPLNPALDHHWTAVHRLGSAACDKVSYRHSFLKRNLLQLCTGFISLSNTPRPLTCDEVSVW